MIKLVHEQSERDLRMQDVKNALARMTAQLIRLSAGAASMYRFKQDFRAFLGALRELPPGSTLLLDHEALQFENWDAQYDDVDDVRNEIIRQALRLAASRIERNQLQDARTKPGFLCRSLQQGRPKRDPGGTSGFAMADLLWLQRYYLSGRASLYDTYRSTTRKRRTDSPSARRSRPDPTRRT